MQQHRPIVVIDDDMDDREILGTILNEMNLPNQVVFLQDGQSGYEFLSKMETSAAVILCDINMPKLSGLELKRLINKDTKLAAKCIPFYFLTTTVSKQTAEEAFALGVQGFYVKENSFDSMSQLIKYIIESSKHGVFPKDLESGEAHN